MRRIEGLTALRVQALGLHAQSASGSGDALPCTPNTTCGVDPLALWRAPGDWLVCSRTQGSEALSQWVAGRAPRACELFVTDISSAHSVLELQGPRVIEVLQRECTLDLEGEAIRRGACAHTSFAATPVTIHRPTERDDTWWMFVERSVALHVWEWLAETAASED